ATCPLNEVWPIQTPIKRRPPARRATRNLSKESLSEQRKKAISDSGHSRRRDRQGSGSGRAAGAGGGCEKARRRRAFRSFRFRVLGLLRKARRDDAGGLEGENRQARSDLFR